MVIALSIRWHESWLWAIFLAVFVVQIRQPAAYIFMNG